MPEFTYKKAGVDIDEGERFVKRIRAAVKKTFRPEVLTDIGSFGALFKLDMSKYREPVLVSGTDGVGTKLKVAFKSGIHNTVGIDLVAMCVNDIITSGAEPLFFLDYFATGKLSSESAALVVEGIVAGCTEAGCALIGGETAEMPGFYAEGEYDLSGFAVGVVERDEIVDGSGISEGDTLVGIYSNGVHSNGYSLVRKILFEHMKYEVSTYVDELKSTVGEELLRPTIIYAKAVAALRPEVGLKGMAHITGGGIPGNVPRMLPEGLHAVVDTSLWPEQPIFGLLRRLGKVPEEDMRRTFNMGIGYVVCVSEKEAESSVEILRKIGFHSCIIGRVHQGGRGVFYAGQAS